MLSNVSSYNNLGVIVDHHLKFYCHIDKMCAKANQRTALILRRFRSRDPVLISKAFTIYVRPIL